MKAANAAECLLTNIQVLGVTNYSHWGDAGQMRRCMWDSEAARSHMQELALARIEKFIHVGSTGKLFESVEAAAVRDWQCSVQAIFIGMA